MGIVDILSIVSLCLFFTLLFTRVILLRKKGVKVIVFGNSPKSDFLLIPPLLLLIYAAISPSLSLPFPKILIKSLSESLLLSWIGVFSNIFGLVCFALSLKAFGNSFRIGIDNKQPDKLITHGVFAISRNPIYVSFFFIFSGLTLIYLNIVSIVMLTCFFVPLIHRQVLREEKFMKKHYSEQYTEYYKKVRRYL